VHVSGGSGGLKNTKITKETQQFILVQAIEALHLVCDDPYTQEHPKSRGVTTECKGERYLVGDCLWKPRHRWCLPPRRKVGRQWMQRRGSRCPFLGCFALDAERELNGEDSNDMFGILLPLLGSNLPLYIEIGRVHGSLGELSQWSTCARVQKGLATASCGPWRCRGAKEALGVIRLLCSDTLSVRLCRLRPASTRCTI
jgi:hypothetical protein